MKADIKKAISSAIVRVLTPLVRMLLKHNIPYGTFAELAKWVYVDVAFRDFKVEGRKQTISRVSTITGLTRKEVKRLRELEGPDDLGAAERYNRAMRVISGWLKDSRYTDSQGQPKRLPLEGKNSFSELVKEYSGDIPHRAILDEMRRAGVVEVEDNMVRLLSKGYIVTKSEIDQLAMLGTDVSEFISTIYHNITCDPSEVYLQRKTVYDNIPQEYVEEIREQIRKKGQEFLEEIDQLISRYDRDVNPSIKGTGRKRLGLGIFYFE
ncbi:MAG: hypothetical protein GXO99_05500 [Nitrospirae bacterium]|nr:hypothetical protein [Nitrospirota bacterium]